LRQDGNFFLRKGHSKSWSAKFVFRPPKLGVKSPCTHAFAETLRTCILIPWIHIYGLHLTNSQQK